MNQIICFAAILACAAAAPGYLVAHETPVFHAIHAVPSKTTVTKSSQVVNHGGHAVLHSVPVVHTVHKHVIPVMTKSTITKSSQVVNHGGHSVLHAAVPVVHAEASLIHSVPSKSTITKSSQVVNHGGHAVVGHVVHAPLVHTAPLVSLRTGSSAVSHSSQSVHETVPLVAVHHGHH